MKTIAVIEDDIAILELIRDVLEDVGYHVLTAKDGQEGLACLALVRPDLIICDIMMPALDGRKMCHIVRANPHYEDVPIILISAANQRLKRQFPNSTFLLKPFNIQDLLATVNHFLIPASSAA